MVWPCSRLQKQSLTGYLAISLIPSSLTRDWLRKGCQPRTKPISTRDLPGQRGWLRGWYQSNRAPDFRSEPVRKAYPPPWMWMKKKEGVKWFGTKREWARSQSWQVKRKEHTHPPPKKKESKKKEKNRGRTWSNQSWNSNFTSRWLTFKVSLYSQQLQEPFCYLWLKTMEDNQNAGLKRPTVKSFNAFNIHH